MTQPLQYRTYPYFSAGLGVRFCVRRSKRQGQVSSEVDSAFVMNYHKSADGTWRRCRAVKRPGVGVDGCSVLKKFAHAVGRQGVAARGGGTIIEQRANGYPMTTKISPILDGYYFTATSASGHVRYYLQDGRLLSRQERKWLKKGLLTRKIQVPPSLIKQHRRKLHQESLIERPFSDFSTHDFGNTKQNEERDTFVAWFKETNHFGAKLEELTFRFGDDNNQNHKEPDLIVRHPSYKDPIGVELVRVYAGWKQGVSMARMNPKLPIQAVNDHDYLTLLENVKRTLDQKCSKKYVKHELSKLILLTENLTEYPVQERLQKDTKRDSKLFDEAWIVNTHPRGKKIMRLGVNLTHKPVAAERDEDAI